MIQGIKKIFSRKPEPQAEKEKSRSAVRSGIIRARYDAASHSVDNMKHWAAAEMLSADAEARAGVRRTLRIRSRYEVANNSYAKGIILTIANDTIGTGPRLQCLTKNDKTNSRIERDFMAWAESIDLPGKLRTVRMARCQDGETFILMVNNPKAKDKFVKLDLQLIEADRVSDDLKLMENRIDGITFDDFGNPISYRVLKYHPGSDELCANPLEAKEIPARYIIHYFRADRPGQHRGVPEITPALPLFAQLRRFTLAVLSAAEAAADFAGILYTDSPAGGESEDLASMDGIELERNMLLTMPGGWKMGQLDPKQPCSTYSEFKANILNEIARCLNMPYNIAAGNSSGYNYASGRLDHQTYYKSIRVEQRNIVSVILDRIFAAWLKEYSLAVGTIYEDVDHTWFWDGLEHIDPSKEANATSIRLNNHTTTYAAEFAKMGRDWEDEFQQIAKEKRAMQELGIAPEDVFPVSQEGNQEE